jgi:hypothetical protein
MNSVTKATLINVLKSALAFVSIMLIAISGEMAAHSTDKFYPILLLLSVVYLQCVSWDFFFEIIGIPANDEKRIRKQFKPIARKVLLARLIPVGYLAILASFFAWYMPQFDGIPKQTIKYGVIFVAVGLLAQMFAVIRMLISEKYRDGKEA